MIVPVRSIQGTVTSADGSDFGVAAVVDGTAVVCTGSGCIGLGPAAKVKMYGSVLYIIRPAQTVAVLLDSGLAETELPMPCTSVVPLDQYVALCDSDDSQYLVNVLTGSTTALTASLPNLDGCSAVPCGSVYLVSCPDKVAVVGQSGSVRVSRHFRYAACLFGKPVFVQGNRLVSDGGLPITVLPFTPTGAKQLGSNTLALWSHGAVEIAVWRSWSDRTVYVPDVTGSVNVHRTAAGDLPAFVYTLCSKTVFDALYDVGIHSMKAVACGGGYCASSDGVYQLRRLKLVDKKELIKKLI